MLIRQANLKSPIFVIIWYFLNKGFKFLANAYNGCHDLLLMSMNLSDIAILKIKGADCRCIITGINKKEAINLMQNNDLTKKCGILENMNFIIIYKNG